MTELQAIVQEAGIQIVKDKLFEKIKKFALIDDKDVSYYQNLLHAVFFDDDGVLTLTFTIPTEEHFEQINKKIHILTDNNGLVAEIETPSIQFVKGVGGSQTIKLAVAGEAGEVVFKHDDYLIETEALNLFYKKAEVDNSVTEIKKNINDEASVRKIEDEKLSDEIVTVHNTLDFHTTNKKNPHSISKAHIGLSNVPNYPATSSITDSSTSKFATAKAVRTVAEKIEDLQRQLNNLDLVASTVLFDGRMDYYTTKSTYTMTRSLPASYNGIKVRTSGSYSKKLPTDQEYIFNTVAELNSTKMRVIRNYSSANDYRDFTLELTGNKAILRASERTVVWRIVISVY